MDYADAIGLVAVVLSTGCYARLQWRREFAKTLHYSAINACACAMMIFCLMHHWSLASFLSNALWFCFSLYGVYRCMKYKWRERAVRRISD